METVSERYRARLLDDPPQSASTVSEWLEALTEDGRWPDIDYDDRSRTDWEPHEALDRIDQIADIVVLVQDWLTDSQRTDALAVVDRTDPDGTGANLLWTAKIAFLHGCLVGNASVAMSAVREAASEVHLTTGDGVQPDDSPRKRVHSPGRPHV